MNPQFYNGIGGLAVLAILWGLGVTIAWLIIGWRAMRAHEKIADELRDYLRNRQ